MTSYDIISEQTPSLSHRALHKEYSYKQSKTDKKGIKHQEQNFNCDTKYGCHENIKIFDQ